MSQRNRPHRLDEVFRPVTGSRRVRAPIIVELSWNAPARVLAADEEAIQAVASLAVVDLVRIPQQRTFCIRGPLVAWNAPASAARRQYRAMEAFAAAFEAAQAAAGGSGDGA